MSYCDECCSYTCDGRYHDYFDCGMCGGELTVTVGPASPNPESGDEWFCDACATSGPW